MNEPAMCASPRLIKAVESPRVRILFLGYDENKTKIIGELASRQCEVFHTNEKIASTEGFDLAISFGYAHILKKHVIESSKAPIVNLHISYLPWNRGAHPNFWSFYDATPSGVTIHLIDEGVDTGPILYQKYVNFADEEITFVQTYNRLVMEIEALFVEKIESIISKSFVPKPQRGKGSLHRVSDLPKEFNGWDSIIEDEIARLDVIAQRYTEGK